MTVEQKERNRKKSKVRSRVENVFGFKEQTMGGLLFRGVGMIRAKANIAKVERRASLFDMPRCSNVTIGNIALTNLVYNICRQVQIKKYHPNLITIQQTEYQVITLTLSKKVAKYSFSNKKKL